MKKFYITILVLAISNTLIAQINSKQREFAEIMHANDIEQRVRFIKENKTRQAGHELLKNEINKDALYNKLSEVYLEAFTADELEAMLPIYTSPIGKKIMKKMRVVNLKASSIIGDWEMEQQGIIIEEVAPPDLSNEGIPMIPDQEIPEFIQKRKKNVIPKIETLEDLKALVLKNPYMIAEHDLLLQLIGKAEFDKLVNPGENESQNKER